jgi:predicted N-formylglutamate amidohydrolase
MLQVLLRASRACLYVSNSHRYQAVHDTCSHHLIRHHATNPWADDCCWLGRVVGRQIDVNRPLTDQGSGQVHPTLVRSVADNLPVDLNRNVSNDEIQRRIAQFYAPYHSAISTVVSSYRPRLLISMHSFNSVYEGQKRDIEIGVLCNENAYPADAVCAASTTASIVPTAVTVGDNTSRRDRGVNQLAVG